MPINLRAMKTLHFTPPDHWMNDPNGLVAHAGRYHLFYQYNPYATEHGNMSWGHASSTDLFSWEHHPVALACTDTEQIYSGSAVVDQEAVSGYGSPDAPALLAFYTSLAMPSRLQTQAVAYSLDDGLTWTQHPGNPVLDRGSHHFRDPKVVAWQGPQGHPWVMVTVLAEQHQVAFYGSDDLLTWLPLSVFGPLGAVDGAWECPDMFPLEVDDTGDRLWVLLVSVFSGAVAGGSGTQYFLGHFDGVTFTPVRRPDAAPHDADWLDHGTDNYAGVTYAGLPDDQRILIGWMSNWQYARELPPQHGVAGAMTIPRRLRLTREATSWPVLAQDPILPADLRWEEVAVGGASWSSPNLLGDTAVFDVTLNLGSGAQAAIRLRGRADGTGGVVVGVTEDAVSVDRTAASVGTPPGFTAVAQAPRVVRGEGRVRLLIVLDEGSVEVFADDGTAALTCLIFPEPEATSASIVATAGDVQIETLRIGRLD